MNIQQFQYVLAVAESKHFERAAQKCFITQSTLSTMISKFEDEIGIQIFDRKKKPVAITTDGILLIDQLKIIVNNIDQLDELAKEIKGEVKGKLTISVIPTIAPFLLPLFLQSFASKFPELTIEVREQTTQEIIQQIKSRDLDIGIISIPVKDDDIVEIDLYDEPFVFYNAGRTSSKPISINEIDMQNLCLMEEGHCMRTQVANLCDFKKDVHSNLNFEFKAGSIDSLLRFVRANGATTLLPYLSTLDFSEKEKKHVSSFSEPLPYRTVGCVVHRHFVKKNIITMLQQEIIDKVSEVLPFQTLAGKRLLPME
jgi:LysR family transcriptional regulator, hydrogen peroxide-inducible genes activator